MTAVDVSLLTDAVRDLLDAQLPVPVGDGAAPDPNPSRLLDEGQGWVTVQMIAAGAAAVQGSVYTDTAELEAVRYQVTAAGIQRNQVERLAQAAISILVERDSDGDYIFPLTVPGHVVLHRSFFGRIPTTSLGAYNAGGIVEILLNVA